MSILVSLPKAYSICLNDVINHPVFGELKIVFIDKEEEKDYTLWCELVEFNNTVKCFEGLDLVRIKYRRKTRMRVVK